MHSMLGRLRRRPEFLHVAAGRRRSVTPGLVLQARRRPTGAGAPAAACGQPRVGFTASRKVGGAVARNRARRRLRAAVAEVMPGHAAPENDYVVIARAATLSRPYRALIADLETALRRLDSWRDAAAGDGP